MTTTSAPAARFVATHSLLTLDARHPFTAKSLADAQDMHRTVMSGFPGWVDDGSADARAQMNVLSTWSLNLKDARLHLVVQSGVPADWDRIPRAALAERPEVRTVDARYRAGDELVFRTVVNAVRSRKTPTDAPDARGKRVSHTTPEHARNWFARRLQPTGEPPVAPDGVVRIGADADPGRLTVRLLPKATSNSVHRGLKLGRTEVKGRLTVTDPAAFVAALTRGIGHGRAYSCGLLLVR
ncbi:type I-E CRISPR-associated protein Cas6/Cse3/CasE [Streptomyces sp. NPDC088674]|uniref:type I-E CRISPR-associated protein Cas6/Cse3/CasE n=1 Tax=Streptomyces sp. NPDC088674 TaxID=3365869 RepID=UPI0038220240